MSLAQKEKENQMKKSYEKQKEINIPFQRLIIFMQF